MTRPNVQENAIRARIERETGHRLRRISSPPGFADFLCQAHENCWIEVKANGDAPAEVQKKTWNAMVAALHEVFIVYARVRKGIVEETTTVRWSETSQGTASQLRIGYDRIWASDARHYAVYLGAVRRVALNGGRMPAYEPPPEAR